MSQIRGHCRHPELLVKTWPLTVTHVSYLGLPGTLLPGNGACFVLRSCRQNPDSLLRLSGVCSMLSKVTMTSRFSDVPFFFPGVRKGTVPFIPSSPEEDGRTGLKGSVDDGCTCFFLVKGLRMCSQPLVVGCRADLQVDDLGGGSWGAPGAVS